VFLYSKLFLCLVLFSTISYSASITEELSLLREDINNLHITISEDLNKTSNSQFDTESSMAKGVNSIIGFFAFIGTATFISFRRYMKSFKKDQINLLKEFAIKAKEPKISDKDLYNKMKAM